MKFNFICSVLGSVIFTVFACLAFEPIPKQIIVENNIMVINLHVILDLAVFMCLSLAALACIISSTFFVPNKKK